MCQDRGRLGSLRFSFFWFHGDSKSEHSAISSAGEEIPAAHSQECLKSCEYEQSLLPLSSGSLDWQRVGLMLVRKAVREVHLLHLSEKGPEGKQRHGNHPSCHRQWHFRNDFICQPDSSFPDSSESCHGLHTPCGTKHEKLEITDQADQDSRFRHCTLICFYFGSLIGLLICFFYLERAPVIPTSFCPIHYIYRQLDGVWDIKNPVINLWLKLQPWIRYPVKAREFWGCLFILSIVLSTVLPQFFTIFHKEMAFNLAYMHIFYDSGIQLFLSLTPFHELYWSNSINLCVLALRT